MKNQLQLAGQRGPTDLDALNDSLQSIHAEFIDVHTELCDLIESNEAFSVLGTVNSLSLEQYYSAVNNIYQEASDFYNTHYAKFINQSISRSIEAAQRLLADSKDSRQSINCIDSCEKLLNHYLSLYGSRHED